MVQTEFRVTLTRGDELRSWEIRRYEALDISTFRVVAPGNVWMGGLLTPEAVEAKRRDFEAEIDTARANGWE